MHDVDAHEAGLRDAEYGVEVRPVTVDQPSRLVYQARDLQEVLFEQPQGIGVGEHQAGDAVVELRPEVEHIHVAA